MVSAKSCIIFAAENQNTQTMKATKKQNRYRVSDRAYCTIISNCIDSMTGCKIDPFTFKQVVTAVSSYLRPEGKITGLGRKAKPIFDRLLPDLDRAIRRATIARTAAARRKEAEKPVEPETIEPTEPAEVPEAQTTEAPVTAPESDASPLAARPDISRANHARNSGGFNKYGGDMPIRQRADNLRIVRT